MRRMVRTTSWITTPSPGSIMPSPSHVPRSMPALVAGARRAGATVREGVRCKAVGPWDGTGRTVTLATPDGEIARACASRDRRRWASQPGGTLGRIDAVSLAASLAPSCWPRRALRRHDRARPLRRDGSRRARGFRVTVAISPLGQGRANVAFVRDRAMLKGAPGFGRRVLRCGSRGAARGAGRPRGSTPRDQGNGGRAVGAGSAAGGGGRRIARRRCSRVSRPIHGRGGVQGTPGRGTCRRNGGPCPARGPHGCPRTRPVSPRAARAFVEKTLANYLVQLFVHVPPLMNYITPRLGARPALARQLVLVLGDLGTARERRALFSPAYLWRLLRP